MFREMRRNKQALTAEEIAEILKRNTSGVLAVNGDGGYPYAVPLSYVYLDSKLYFHCAGTGHKLDSILRDDKVSFCVIDQDQVVGEEYTTYFRSVIAFGRARVLEGAEKLRPLVERWCALFGGDAAALLEGPFTVVTPDSRNPYRQMYAAN